MVIVDLMVMGYILGAFALHVHRRHRETATAREYLSVMWKDFLDWAWN